jgi:hypothetical protein
MIIPRRMGWAGHIARMGKKINAYRILAENFKAKKKDNLEDTDIGVRIILKLILGK